MFLIIGLGNPGKKYENTRHNIGFRVVDILKRRLANTSVASMSQRQSGDRRLTVLYKPSTFMNLSGEDVRRKMDSMQASPKDIVLIYDDIDLPLGKVRFKEKGSSGGHRGVQSIIDILDTEDLRRLRLGVGRPPKNRSAEEHVLEEFDQNEQEEVKKMIDKAIEIVLDLISK